MEPRMFSERVGKAVAGRVEAGTARLGILTEPVVSLAGDRLSYLYRECHVRMQVTESVLLAADTDDAIDIGLLDAAVLDLVLGTLAEDSTLVLGCNISFQTLQDRLSWERIARRISDRPWLARRLVLELTESGSLDISHVVFSRLAALKIFGCRLAIADFGACLTGTPCILDSDVDWDFAKIDRGGPVSLRKVSSQRQALKSLIAIAGCYARTVVVDGIETSAQLAVARDAGALHAQGSLFAAGEIERWRTFEDGLGGRLAQALVRHGAVASRVEAATSSSALDPSVLLTRVDSLGGWVKVLMARAQAGRTSK